MGYQASITGSDGGDNNTVQCENKHSDLERTPSTARFLTTASEIASFASEGMLSTQIAGFVVNCPFVEVDGGYNNNNNNNNNNHNSYDII
jgi:hypothetical protein